jgi:hypothetical protein
VILVFHHLHVQKDILSLEGLRDFVQARRCNRAGPQGNSIIPPLKIIGPALLYDVLQSHQKRRIRSPLNRDAQGGYLPEPRRAVTLMTIPEQKLVIDAIAHNKT